MMEQLDLQGYLEHSLKNNSIIVSAGQQLQLLRYVQLLMEWNKVQKLTANSDGYGIITDHVIDSLRIKEYIAANDYCLDFGTGAGLPGLILAIVDPNIKWVLLDSRLKVMSFLQYVVADLRLTNVDLVEKRVEEYTDNVFDIIVARAVSETDNIINLTKHLLKDLGKWLLMKGKKVNALAENLPIGYYRTVIEFQNVAKARSLAIISRGR